MQQKISKCVLLFITVNNHSGKYFILTCVALQYKTETPKGTELKMMTNGMVIKTERISS